VAELRASGDTLIVHNLHSVGGGVLWERNFSEVKAAIDCLKARGVTDFARTSPRTLTSAAWPSRW